jgi:SAM-dependent methyltransferase
MINTWSVGTPDAMDEELILGTAASAASHPWFRARSSLVGALLTREGLRPPARVLDVGCGWGVTLTHLESQGFSVTGLDISRKSLARLDGPERELIEADITQDLPPKTGTWDGVLVLDVLEHLDDPAGVLTNVFKLLSPGGTAIISVPAMPELFSDFDRISGHLRRYRREELSDLLAAQSSLENIRLYWWGSWLVPLVRWSRGNGGDLGGPNTRLRAYQKHLTPPARPLRLLYDLLFRAEQRLSLSGRTQQGTSLVAVARRCR